MSTSKVWVIAYINRDHIDIANEELKKYGHTDIEAYIPTVRVLKKKFKGKNVFEFVPLLFNYGFFKIPYEKAINPDYLMELRHHITCIYAWVKDPAKNLNTSKKSGLRADNTMDRKALPNCAIASDKEVSDMVRATESMSIYNSDDLKRFKPGDHLQLEGYPFDGMPAEIVKINHKKGEVVVKLNIEEIVRQVTVSFENVFYSVYKNYDENSREQSTDEMVERFGPGVIDHLSWKSKNFAEDE